MAKKKAVRKVSDVVSVPLVWLGVEDEPVRAVNQAYSQFDPKGLFILTLGMANPPPLMGGTGQNRKTLEAIDAVTVTTVARLAMTEAHAEAVMKILQTNLKQFRRMKKAGEAK